MNMGATLGAGPARAYAEGPNLLRSYYQMEPMPQISSGPISIEPEGHSATQRPQPLQKS